MRKYLPTIGQMVWLTSLLLASCYVSYTNSVRQAEAYHKLEAKMDAMVEHLGGEFIPAPIRPEREGYDL